MQNIIKNKKLLIVISAVFVIALFSVVLYQDSFAEVNVTVDGETQSIKTTNETVGEVIKESDIYIGDADYINFDENQKLEKGMDIVIKRSRPVTIEIGTRTITKKTYKDNIKDILKDFDITLGKDDKVSPGLNAKYTDAAIKLTQVEKKEIVEEKELEFTTLYKDNKGLELGKTNTVEKGIKGLKEIKKSQTFENGKLVKEDVISEEIVKEPVNQIVEKGKKPLTVASRGTKIERKTVSKPVKKETTVKKSSPAPKKEVQKPAKKPAKKAESKPASSNKFNARKTITMRSTAYSIKGTTASGVPSGPGKVAVDPNVIPLGTRLYIESLDGWEDYGYAIAADTGSAIKGNIIDVFYSNRSTALKYGRRNIKVHILN